MVSQEEFEKVVNRFLKIEDARGKLWYRARKMLEDKYELEAYVLILSTWNFADFRYFLRNFDLNAFERTIEEIKPVFKRLKEITFEKADFSDTKLQKDIKEIYSKFKAIARQTGASKIMALKRPDLFIMWDTRIRKMYKIDNKASPDDYIEFLIKMKKKFENIKWQNKKNPLAKVIDEYNFVLANSGH